MVAAVVAAIRGLRVLVVEKTGHVGGTTAYSSGTAWMPDTDLADGRVPADTRADAARYLEWMAGTDAGRDLRQAFLASTRDALRFLHRHTDVQFMLPANGPDYRVGPGSAEGGRALVAREFDGRLLGADFALLRAPRPGFNVLGGMMVGRADLDALLAPLSSVKAFRHSARILVRHLRDRLIAPRGTRLVLGNALVARLLHEVRKRGVELRMGTMVESFATTDGRVTAPCSRTAKAKARASP